jgi:hypothetical protein
MLSTRPVDLGYNGLTEHTEGLPADAYYPQQVYTGPQRRPPVGHFPR